MYSFLKFLFKNLVEIPKTLIIDYTHKYCKVQKRKFSFMPLCFCFVAHVLQWLVMEERRLCRGYKLSLKESEFICPWMHNTLLIVLKKKCIITASFLAVVFCFSIVFSPGWVASWFRKIRCISFSLHICKELSLNITFLKNHERWKKI